MQVTGIFPLIICPPTLPDDEDRVQTRLDPFAFTASVTGTHENPYLHGKVPAQHVIQPEERIEKEKSMLMIAAAEIIHGTNSLVWKTAGIRQKSMDTAAFEIGFVMRTMEESYKKMLDMYNSTIQMGLRIHTRAQIVYLQRVEKLHWEVTHLHNMLHEIERKYKMNTFMNQSGMYENDKPLMLTQSQALKTFTTAKLTTSWWYPLEYGRLITDYYNPW